MTFFFAGMDTTGTTAGWLFYNMALYPDKMKKLIEEISTFKDELKYEDLNKMDYTTAFIKETLRMYPPVASAIPRIPRKKTKIGGDIDVGPDTPLFLL